MRCKAGSSSTTRTHAWRSPRTRKPWSSDDVSPMPPAPGLIPATAITPVSGCRIACLVLAFVCVDAAMPTAAQSPTLPPGAGQEPITPTVAVPTQDTLRLALGERLFSDRRLSHDNTRSCLSCHDIPTNGASSNGHDLTPEGQPLPFNTPTIFNAALNFRLNWE